MLNFHNLSRMQIHGQGEEGKKSTKNPNDLTVQLPVIGILGKIQQKPY